MRIGVFGAGGLGGYFGGRLAQSGQNVIFVDRGDHLLALQRNGIQVESLDGDFHLTDIQATNSPSDAGRCDIILMAVKAWQLDQAAKSLGPMIGPHTVVVPLQNGVEAVPVLISRLGERHVVGGMAKLISERVRPGFIHHFGSRPLIAFGELNNGLSERLQALRSVFIEAGVDCEIPTDIHAALWEKFLSIVGWGGPAAVARAPLGALRGVAESRALIAAAMHEVADVAQARGIEIGSDVVERNLTFLDNLPAESSTSLQRDIEHERPSELEALCGSVLQLGREVGVPTPVNAFCHAALLPLEMRARGQIDFAATHPHY